MSEFKLPDLGEGVHEGQIIKLHANVGDFVKEDDPFMEVETDKAAVEIRAPFTGTIQAWHVKEGEIAHVGDVMVTYAAGDSSDAASSTVGAATSSAVNSGGQSATLVESKVAANAPVNRSGASRHKPASPATRKFAREMGVDIEIIEGTGPNGRVTRADVERAASAPAASSPPARAAGVTPPAQTTRPAPPSPKELPPGEDEVDAYGPIRIAPISLTRKTIASIMATAWSTIPHVTDSDDADVTELEQLRKGYPSPENNNRKLTMLAFIVRAVAQALVRHPIFNAVFDADKELITYRRYINVAVGVHTERGLVAPVIRNAELLSVVQIADALDVIVEKARAAKFTVDDTRGGTYTISNAGAFGGSHYSTPIVTPGQSAVLAAGRTRWMPWVVDGQIEPRFIMPLSHSFDHRIADGGEEIAFLQDIIGQLENPARLMF